MTFPVFIKANRTRISIQKEIREVNRLRLQFERSMTARMAAVFKKAGKDAAREYTAQSTVSNALRPLEAQIEQVFRAHYASVIQKFGNRVYENRKLESFTSLVFNYYEREGARKVVGIAETTRSRINKIIRDREQDGLGVNDVAKSITEYTEGAIGRARAATIARSETHAAASYATHQATKELKLPAQRKRWVSVGDSRTRDHHAAANGQEVDIDQPFIIRWRGAEIEMQYPHDGSGGAGNNINCRCLAVYFTDEDELFSDFGGAENIQDTPPPRANEKPKLDLRDVMDVRGFAKDDLNDHIQKYMTPMVARIADKLPKPRTIVGRPKYGTYYAYNRRLETGMGRQTATHEYGHHLDREIGQLDGVGDYWSSKGLAAAWAADRKHLGLARASKEKKKEIGKRIRRELFEVKEVQRDLTGYPESHPLRLQYGDSVNVDLLTRGEKGFLFQGSDGLSDIVDSFFKGRFRKDFNVYGHSIRYWKDKDNGPNEAFANLIAIGTSPEAVKWAEKNIPNLWREFNKKLEEVDANLSRP